MFKYVIRKFIASLITIWIIVTLAFIAIRLAPGDPALVILQDYATPERVANLRHYLGLDQPLHVQYGQYLWKVLQGDLGRSFRTNRPVITDIIQQYPFTLTLAISSLLFSLPIGITSGIIAAVKRNSMIDVASMLASTIWLSIPAFWFGLILIIIFSVYFGLFPVLGAGRSGDIKSILHALVLPTVCLGARDAAIVSRLTRSAMLDVLNQDYIRTARAKGLIERLVVMRHALRNALIPVISITGVNAISLLGGTVVTETVFSRPGIGSLLVISAGQRDYPIVIGTIFIFSFFVVGINFFVDLIYGFVDPRLSQTEKENL